MSASFASLVERRSGIATAPQKCHIAVARREGYSGWWIWTSENSLPAKFAEFDFHALG